MHLHGAAVRVVQNPLTGDSRKREAEPQAPGFLSLGGRVDLEDRPIGKLGRVVALLVFSRGVWVGSVGLGVPR